MRIGWLVIVAMIVFGCGRHHGVDTGKLRSSFQSGEPTLKAEADKAVGMIKAGHYPEALAHLQELAGKARLTADQQEAIKDVVAQIQKQMTDAANVQKAAQDPKTALPRK